MDLEKLSKKIEIESKYELYINNPFVEKRRPQMEEFKGDPDYEGNKRLIENLLGKISKEEIERGTIGRKKSKEREMAEKALEGFLVIEEKEMFGEETEVVPTSRFDDVVNKIDLVLESPFKSKIARLGIDATVSDVAEHIQTKERVNQDRINKRRMNVRYFKSILEPEMKGELNNIPRAIVALPRETFDFLIKNINNERSSGIKSIIFSRMIIDLENQFIYTLIRNTERIDVQRRIKEKEDTRLRLRKRHQEIVEKFNNLVREISNGAWDKMSVLLNFFEENKDIFMKKSVMIPGLFNFLDNIKNTQQWIYDLLSKIKKKAVPSETALEIPKLEHWKPEDFS